jgi:hypothetical protein
MKPCILLMLLAFAPACLTAQQQNPDPDSKQEGLAVWAHLKLMTPSEFQELMTKAQSGNAAAQYQVGLAYDMGASMSDDTIQREQNRKGQNKNEHAKLNPLR